MQLHGKSGGRNNRVSASNMASLNILEMCIAMTGCQCFEDSIKDSKDSEISETPFKMQKFTQIPRKRHLLNIQRVSHSNQRFKVWCASLSFLFKAKPCRRQHIYSLSFEFLFNRFIISAHVDTFMHSHSNGEKIKQSFNLDIGCNFNLLMARDGSVQWCPPIHSQCHC